MNDMMKNLWAKLWPALTPDTFYIFLQGMFWALVLMAVLLVLMTFCWLIFRKSKKVSGVTLDTDRGSLFISASAIADLIYSLDEKFPELEITRVRLIRDRKELAIQVKVFYAAAGQSMLALTESFQNSAAELLKSAFGIENISRIDLIVPKSKF